MFTLKCLSYVLSSVVFCLISYYVQETEHNMLNPTWSCILLQGRYGKGNIYVWASGDGGQEDDCNCDGYAASMWTISINSATNDGQTAGYDESCSSTLASTFSNGKSTLRDAGVVSLIFKYHIYNNNRYLLRDAGEVSQIVKYPN